MTRSPKQQPKAPPGLLSRSQYQRLVASLRRLLTEGRDRAEAAVGRELVLTYHAVGTRLLAEELTGRAGYGTATLQRVADDLTVDLRTLQRAIAFARAYPDGPPDGGLRWAHYRELLLLPKVEQREWYEAEAAAQRWSAPKLRRAVQEEQYRNRTTDVLSKSPRRPIKQLRRPAHSFYLFKAKIDRVVDGDTILALVDLGFEVHKSQRLRLAAIDTPALDTPEGARATKLVQEELAQVDFVVLMTDRIDLYGRYVAHVFYQPGDKDKDRIFTEGRYLNQRLVDEGVAKAL
jgi:endonuclease YncB( thermonuclease family)